MIIEIFICFFKSVLFVFKFIKLKTWRSCRVEAKFTWGVYGNMSWGKIVNETHELVFPGYRCAAPLPSTYASRIIYFCNQIYFKRSTSPINVDRMWWKDWWWLRLASGRCYHKESIPSLWVLHILKEILAAYEAKSVTNESVWPLKFFFSLMSSLDIALTLVRGPGSKDKISISGRAVFISGRAVSFSGRAVSISGRAVSISGRSEKNNKSGAERGAKGDSRPGPGTKVNAMSKSEKKL